MPVNDATRRELNVIVERAVRPIRASLARQRRIREELLAHLVSIFEEQAEQLGDEVAALEQAKKRFGDPRQLAAQLQQSVPRLDGLARLSEQFLNLRPGESVCRSAIRGAVTMLLGYVVMIVCLPLIHLAVRGNLAELRLAAGLVLASGIAMSVLIFVLALLIHGMRLALFRGTAERSWSLAAICGVASAFLFPVFGFVLYWTLTGDVSSSCAHLRSLSFTGLLFPVLLVTIARQFAAELRYQEEWASLEIDE